MSPDPRIFDALEIQLSDLAMEWRGSRTSGDSSGEAILLREYHAVMKKLWDYDWRAGLLPDMELPDEYMPAYYIKWRNRGSDHR